MGHVHSRNESVHGLCLLAAVVLSVACFGRSDDKSSKRSSSLASQRSAESRAAEASVPANAPAPMPERYTVTKVGSPLKIDGVLDEPAWKAVPATRSFVVAQTGKPAAVTTDAKLLWDNQSPTAVAWNAPMANDIHKLDRFGELVFGNESGDVPPPWPQANPELTEQAAALWAKEGRTEPAYAREKKKSRKH